MQTAPAEVAGGALWEARELAPELAISPRTSQSVFYVYLHTE